MLGFQGPGQPSPALGDALNAGYCYPRSEVPRLQRVPDRCPRHRPATRMNRTYIVQCSVRTKRSHLVALRAKISASDPPSTWWPGER